MKISHPAAVREGLHVEEHTGHRERLEKAFLSVQKQLPKMKKAKYRQRYHFMAPAFWINDPNGLIWYQGEYHLFYQYNPFAPCWGEMHWGHAVSSDLVHWKHLPLALAPSEDYDDYELGGCFSGSAVQHGEKLCLFYTGVCCEKNGDEVQRPCLACSGDGVNFTKYRGNPVIRSFPADGSRDFRDPKVWKSGRFWYMAVGSSKNGRGRILLYRSVNLTDWEYMGVMAGSDGKWGTMWECPDFFSLQGKDVLLFSPVGLKDRKAVYSIGSFNESNGNFTPESEGEVDWGFDFYAPQSFSDPKGRRIVIGWANSWDWMPWWNGYGPTQCDGWCGAMSLPRSIKWSGEGVLRFEPIEELQQLRKNHAHLPKTIVVPERPLPLPVDDGISYEICAEIDLSSLKSDEFYFQLRCGREEKTTLTFDRLHNQLTFDRTHSDSYSGGVKSCLLPFSSGGRMRIRIFVDTSSIEIFVNDGATVMSGNIYPDLGSTGASFAVRNGSVTLLSVDTWGLSSIW